jgi:hypothetical protein
MICGDVSSVGGQSSSADESDSTMSFAANVRKKGYEKMKDNFIYYYYIDYFNAMG